MARKTVLRFAFELENEQGRQRLSNTGWRVTANRNDVYITAKSLGDVLKVSIHDEIHYRHERPWLLAYTKEHMASDRPVWPRERDRIVRRFKPTKFHDGVRRVFAIAISRGCLTPHPQIAKEVPVIVPDRWDRLTVVNVLMTETSTPPPGWDLVSPTTLALDNGRHVWIAKYTEPIKAIDPESVPDSTMLEPHDPDEDGVACPGFLVRPVRIKRNGQTESAE